MQYIRPHLTYWQLCQSRKFFTSLFKAKKVCQIDLKGQRKVIALRFWSLAAHPKRRQKVLEIVGEEKEKISILIEILLPKKCPLIRKTDKTGRAVRCIGGKETDFSLLHFLVYICFRYREEPISLRTERDLSELNWKKELKEKQTKNSSAQHFQLFLLENFLSAKIRRQRQFIFSEQKLFFLPALCFFLCEREKIMIDYGNFSAGEACEPIYSLSLVSEWEREREQIELIVIAATYEH